MKKVLRRIAVLLIGLAVLFFAAAYTSITVGEKEMYIKAESDSDVHPASTQTIQTYKIIPNKVSAEVLKAEADKAKAAYQKQLEEELKRKEDRAKYVKALKEKYTGKLVAFTFDDGPGNYTDKLLDGLKERKAHATFMILGSRIGSYEDTVLRMMKEGHQIGCHSWSHPDLSKLSEKEIKNELDPTVKLIKDLGYKETIVLRPPYGAYNDKVLKALGAPVILWNVDTLDWRHKGDAKTVYNNILRDAHDGAIILLHDIYGSSVEAALKAMDALEKEGYQFVTVDELLAIRDVEQKDGKIYYSAPKG